MSLVVAQATEHGPRITSDIQVVGWDRRALSLSEATLKAIVLSKWVTICFAGSVVDGLRAIREFSTGLDSGQSVENMLPMLAQVAIRGDVDFIVARRHRSEQLTRITGQGIERCLQVAWVGDQDGFNAFQLARASLQSQPSIKSLPARIMWELRMAMDAVIKEEAIPNVGGFEVAVANTEAGFEYFGSAIINVGRDFSVSGATEDLIPLMIQSAEDGGYTACLVEPASAGIPAAAVYFQTIGLVYMFLPLQFDAAQEIKGVSSSDFTKIIYDQFGVSMKAPGGVLRKQILG